MLARADADARAGEFGADLIKPPGRDTGLRAMDVEGGDGRMMGGLLREIRKPYLPRGPALDRRGGSVGCTVSGRVYRWSGILHFPVTLQFVRHISDDSPIDQAAAPPPTLKNSPSVELYGLQGLPLMYFCRSISSLVFPWARK